MPGKPNSLERAISAKGIRVCRGPALHGWGQGLACASGAAVSPVRLAPLRLRTAPRGRGRAQKWRPPCSTAGYWPPPPLGAAGPGRRSVPPPRYCGPARSRFEGRQEKGRGGRPGSCGRDVRGCEARLGVTSQ